MSFASQLSDKFGFVSGDNIVTVDSLYKNTQSLAYKARSKRFNNFSVIIEKIIAKKGHCKIADLGGTEYYWDISKEISENPKVEIHLLNPIAEPTMKPNFKSIVADATDLSFIDDNSFDLVHSNSVVEHVGDWDKMSKLANNVRRIAPSYFVQTPNIWFPIEPHFRFIGFQWLPEQTRVKLLQNFNLGFSGKISSYEEALEAVQSIKLLEKKQMELLFPDANIKFEKFFGFNKSIMAIKDNA